MAGNAERTYVMVKPDGVQRGLVAEVIKRFSQRGYKLCGAQTSLNHPPALPRAPPARAPPPTMFRRRLAAAGR